MTFAFFSTSKNNKKKTISKRKKFMRTDSKQGRFDEIRAHFDRNVYGQCLGKCMWFIACDWLQNQKLNVQSRHSLTRYKMNQLKLKIRRKNQNPFCLFMYLHLNTYQQCTVHTVNNITFFASLQTVFLSH